MRQRKWGPPGRCFSRRERFPFRHSSRAYARPPQVIAAWSKLMPRPVTASPERGNETVVVKRASPIPVSQPPEEVGDPRHLPQPVTTVTPASLPQPEPIARDRPKSVITVRIGQPASPIHLSQPIPNVLPYAAQPTPIAVVRTRLAPSWSPATLPYPEPPAGGRGIKLFHKQPLGVISGT
jgi:hypothetical protein